MDTIILTERNVTSSQSISFLSLHVRNANPPGFHKLWAWRPSNPRP